MVIKFTKHDIVDSMSMFLPVLFVHLLLVVLSIISNSFLAQNSLIQSLAVSSMSMVYIALMVLSFRSYIYTVYGSIYNKNAVRNFTTPISSGQLLLSKMLTLTFWNLVIILETVLLFALASLFPSNYMASMYTGMFEGLRELLGLIALLPMSVIVQMVLAFVGISYLPILVIVFAGAIANTSWFGKLRGLITFGLSMVMYIILSTAFVRFMINISIAAYEAMGQPINMNPNLLAWQFIGVVWLVIVICCIGTIWLWNHKLEIMN